MSNQAQKKDLQIGKELHSLLARLFPIHRSITGDGVRRTLDILGEYIPLRQSEVPSGTKAFDWTVPKEWTIRDAYFLDERGRKFADFKKNNLHVVAYSTSVDKTISLEELQQHIHSLPDKSEAIPYVSSYYKEDWGFCLAEQERENLKNGPYHVFIDSELKNGSLTYAECLIPGETSKEILISSYVCHPSLANNELSGPVIASFLGRWLASAPRKYSYRIVFTPETIGAITYISRNLEKLRENVIAGFNLSCLGDERCYSCISSRYEDTLADRVATNVLSFKSPDYKKYSFLQRGSDERQYCSPGVELPLVTLCRSKYGTFPEYHNSRDNLDFVSPAGLQSSYEMLKECLEVIEANTVYKMKCCCEPQLGPRGLYSNVSSIASYSPPSSMNVINFTAYADGTNDLLDMSNILRLPVSDLANIGEIMFKEGLVEELPVALPKKAGRFPNGLPKDFQRIVCTT